MILDIAMTVLWTLTYILALAFSVKYKKEVIPPLTQVIIAPVEFGPLISFFWLRSIEFNYILLAYFIWCILEVLLFINAVRIKVLTKHNIIVYFFTFILLTVATTYLIVYKGQMLFLNYFNTFIGLVVWMFWIVKDNYIRRKSILCVFASKFTADFFAVFFYFGISPISVKILAVALPCVDCVMIITYYIMCSNHNTENDVV